MELLAGRTPSTWRPLGPSTEDEATFLAPLDPVSARGRATSLFGFEYIWEIYKPVELRRWGPYTLPVLWGDQLVARFDARMDRSTATLVVNGLWLEDDAFAKDDAFAVAMQRGMARLRRFLDAGAIDAQAVTPRSLRSAVQVVAKDQHVSVKGRIGPREGLAMAAVARACRPTSIGADIWHGIATPCGSRHRSLAFEYPG